MILQDTYYVLAEDLKLRLSQQTKEISSKAPINSIKKIWNDFVIERERDRESETEREGEINSLGPKF